jgi:hypothetical protein
VLAEGALHGDAPARETMEAHRHDDQVLDGLALPRYGTFRDTEPSADGRIVERLWDRRSTESRSRLRMPGSGSVNTWKPGWGQFGASSTLIRDENTERSQSLDAPILSLRAPGST